jgi:hypothetical protein
MTPFTLEPTKATPSVHFDPRNGQCAMRGMSIPENAVEFYMPLLQWMEIYLSTLPAKVDVQFDLSYFNSSSLKALYQLLARLNQARAMGTDLHIGWVVEEDDEFMREAAEYFQDLLGLELDIVQLPAHEERDQRKAS